MRFVQVLAVLVIVGSISFADIGPTKLETLIEGSDLIVLGKVTDVTTIGHGFKLASVEVTQTVRGQTDAKLRYIASPVTFEDISDARIGETAVLFLRKPKKTPSEYPEDVLEITRGQPLFFIAHSGWGRLVPVSIDGDNWIYFRLGHGILLPQKLLALWKQDPKDSNLGLVRVNDLLDFIEHYASTK